jgi:hypothetical protein
MRKVRFKLGSSDLKKIIDYLTDNYDLDFIYENHSNDMSILASEDLYLRTGSYQFNMIIGKIENEHIIIDVIGGAGGTGLLNISWGSEKSYTKKVKIILRNYVEESNLTFEEIESL